MAEENEYTVECIQRAKLISKRGRGTKKGWLYYVKWKGYDLDDNTWEPPESFDSGSQHFIDRFWDRIDLGDRDWRDALQFKVDEEFFPQGPPRRRTKVEKRVSNEHEEAIAARGDSENEVRSIIGSPERPVSKITKRKRGRPSQAEPEEDARELTRQRKVSRRHSISQASRALRESKVSATPPRGKSRALRRASAQNPLLKSVSRSKTPASHASSDEMLLRPNDTRKPDSRKHEMSSDAAAAAVVERALGAVAEPSSSDGSLFGDGQQEEEQSSVGHNSESMDGDASNSFGVPLLLTPNAFVDGGTRLSSALPAHRARAANPKVKMIEGPKLTEPTNSSRRLSVKAKLTRRSESADHNSQSAAGPSRTANASPSKAGPGMSSRRLQTSGSSSLLTARKGALTTVRPRAKSKRRDTATSIVSMEDPASYAMSLGDGYVFEVSERTSRSHGIDAGQAVLLSAPPPPPTSEELLRMAGLNNADADALPDFEDDLDAHGEPDPDVHSETVIRTVPVIPNGDVLEPRQATNVSSLSLSQEEQVARPNVEQRVKDNATSGRLAVKTGGLFSQQAQGSDLVSPGERRASAPQIPGWKVSTIFGPLGVGREAVKTSGRDKVSTPSSEVSRPTLFLSLDSAVSLQVQLKDVHPHGASLAVLGEKPVVGPSGKFYRAENALTLLDAMRVGGFSARIVLDPGADETHRCHFDRFRSRMQAGDLFVEMVGVVPLAICSSENRSLGQKLQISPDLIGLGDSIVVAQVTIGDYSAYADAVMCADDTRWCADAM